MRTNDRRKWENQLTFCMLFLEADDTNSSILACLCSIHTYNIHKLYSIFVIGFLFLCHLKISKNENHLINISHYYYIKWMLCYVLYDVKSRPTSNYYVYEEIALGCVNSYLLVYQIWYGFNILVISFNFTNEWKIFCYIACSKSAGYSIPLEANLIFFGKLSKSS